MYKLQIQQQITVQNEIQVGLYLTRQFRTNERK